MFATDHITSRNVIPEKWNKRFSTFLGSMLNFFLPMAICLFLCVVLLQMEKRNNKQLSVALSQNKQLLDKLLFICILATSYFLLPHFYKGEIMLLFSVLSSDCSFRELYHYQLDNLKYCILSNIFSVQKSYPQEQDKSQALHSL